MADEKNQDTSMTKSDSSVPPVEMFEVTLSQEEGRKGPFLKLRNKLSPPTRQEPLESANYLTDHQHQYGDYTPAEAEAVRRKIDWRMAPLQIVTSTVSGIDKVLISNAALYGMTADLNLVGQQYSWAGSIFNFGYLIAMLPCTLLLQKLPVGKTLSVAVIMWGILTMLQGVTNGAASLLTLRFLLGAFETALFPALTTLNSMWYTKEEQPVRQAITFSGFQSLVTGLISYGIGQTNTSVAAWRLLFFTVGAMTIVWGVFLIFFLPDSPNKENFLRGREKYIALDRVKKNMTGVENHEFKWYQMREAVTDWRTWTLFLFFLCMNVPNGGLVTFAAQIVSGFGYGRLETVLLGMPTTPFQVAGVFLVAVPQRWLTNKRSISCALALLVPLTCSLLLRYLSRSNQEGRLIAYYFFYFFWAPYATAVSLSMANTGGQSKKTVFNALIFMAYCVAQIIGPQCFRTNEAPNYPTGYNAILGFECGAITCICAYGVGCWFENRRRDAKGVAHSVDELTNEELLSDKTDKERPSFRYVF